MIKPTGKLKFAYESIGKLELEVNKQREIIKELLDVLNPFVNACYSGCSKDGLDLLRKNAENVI